MKINDIEKYATRKLEVDIFSRLLDNTDPIVEDLINYANSLEDKNVWRQMEEYLKHKYNDKYSLGWVGNSNGKYNRAEVYERGYKGYDIVIKYKGLTYIINLLNNYEIHSVMFAYWFLYGFSSHTTLKPANSIEEYSQQALKLIEEDKIKVMKKYNKEIKELRKDFKSKLNTINETIRMLKEVEENE